jgi:hypothetical protein
MIRKRRIRSIAHDPELRQFKLSSLSNYSGHPVNTTSLKPAWEIEEGSRRVCLYAMPED